jgi:hypothetical protein
MLAFKALVEKHDSFNVLPSDLEELQDQANRVGQLGTDIVFKVKELSEFNKYIDGTLFMMDDKVSPPADNNTL